MRLLIAIFLLVIGFGALYVFAGPGPSFSPDFTEAETIGIGAETFPALQDRFVALATEKGALYAYEVLRRAPLPPHTDLHLLGHTVGDELYKQKGVEGMKHCTHDFRNACSHSMVIGALSELGEASLPQVREACKEAPGEGGAYTMCYHGFGHGVLSFFAYRFEETIDFCRQAGTEEYNNREFTECVGGAVMELMGGGDHDRELWLAAREKYLDDVDPVDFCLSDVFPQEVKEICLIYSTPEIWKRAGISLARPQPERFAQAFESCDRIPGSEGSLRRACFGGFGKEFVVIAGERDVRSVDEFSDEVYETALSWCDFAEPQDGKNACVADMLASIFWGGENNPDAAFRFCSLVSDPIAQGECYGRLDNDIFSFVREKERVEALCSRLPEEYQVQCTERKSSL